MLTEALERILKWEQKRFPSTASLLHPGLSDSDFKGITQGWSIQLPTEVCELYKWRNGSGDGSNDICKYACLFDSYAFVPLQEVSVEYQPGTEENRWRYPNDFRPNSLKIFVSNESFLAGYIIISSEGEIDWIEFGYWSDGFWNRKIYYTSLTSMMLTIAECNENAYYTDPQGRLIKDKNKADQIWYKYNSYQFPEANIENLLRQPSWSSINKIVTDLIKFRNHKLSEPLAQLVQRIATNTDETDIRELAAKIIFQKDDSPIIRFHVMNLLDEYWKTRPSATLSLFQKGILDIECEQSLDFLDALENTDEKIKRTVAFLLFMLKAVEPLIQALKHDDSGIRRESAWALGQIGDSTAAQPLIETLYDSDSEVREAAREAWAKLVLKSPELAERIPF